VLMMLQLRRLGKKEKLPQERREELQVFARAGYAMVAGLLVAGVFGHILQRDTWFLLAGLIVARYNLIEAETAEV